MDATAWTVITTGIVILIAIAQSSRSVRAEIKDLREEGNTRYQDLRGRIDAQSQDLRERIDAQGQDLTQQLGQLRERMAHLEGLLEGLREAITGKRVA